MRCEIVQGHSDFVPRLRGLVGAFRFSFSTFYLWSPITLFQTCFLMEDGGGGRSEDRCESVQQLQEVGGASGRRREVQTKSRQPGSSRTNDAAAVAHSSLLTPSSVSRCFDASSSLHATAFTPSTLLLPLHSCFSTFLSSCGRKTTAANRHLG